MGEQEDMAHQEPDVRGGVPIAPPETGSEPSAADHLRGMAAWLSECTEGVTGIYGELAQDIAALNAGADALDALKAGASLTNADDGHTRLRDMILSSTPAKPTA